MKHKIKIIIIISIFIIGYLVLSNNENLLKNNIEVSRYTAITKAIEITSPSVVGINVTQLKQQRTANPFSNPFWGSLFPYSRTYKVESFGSGVIISSDGYVVTNAHVIKNAQKIIVTLMGGDRYEASLIGEDQLTDLALLKIDGNTFPFSILGDSDKLIVGEWAIALGNPLGLFTVSEQPTATSGIISGVNMDFGLKESGHVYQDMIQTDASINPGNSGGPLVNAIGDVIAINTFIMTGSNESSGSIGIGFAIPINRVKEIIGDLKNFGKVERNYTTGVHIQKIDKIMKQYFNLSTLDGVIITDIEKRSSGERAGLKIGDIILQIDRKKVNSPQDVIRVIDEGFHKVGDEIILTVVRDNEPMELALTLEEPQSKLWGF